MAFEPLPLEGEFEPASDVPVKAPGFTAGDYLKGLGAGALRVPGQLTGLVDIPIALATNQRVAGPAVDAIGEVTGIKPSQWAKDVEDTYSPGAKAALSAQGEAWKGSGADELGNALLNPSRWGSGDITKAWEKADLGAMGAAVADYPGATAMNVVQSLPSMAAGGAIGKGLTALKALGPVAAGATGEGSIMAGQAMDAIDPAVEPRKAAGTSLATGVGGAGIALLGGRLAERAGWVDPQTLMAGGRVPAGAGAGLSMPARIAGGAASEALLQEGPQSAMESVLQNYAEDKPLGEGVLRSTVEGAIAGGVLGGGVNLIGGKAAPAPVPAPDTTTQDAAASAAANAEYGGAMNAYDQAGAPMAGLIENTPITNPVIEARGPITEVDTRAVATNPTTGQQSIIDPAAGPLSAAAAGAIQSGTAETTQNIDAGDTLQAHPTQQAAQQYIEQQSDPEFYKTVPHPRVKGRYAAVPLVGMELGNVLAKRKAKAESETRNKQVNDEEGSTNGTTATQTKQAKTQGPQQTNPNLTEEARYARQKTTEVLMAGEAAQAELAPPPTQPISEMPGVQQRAKAQAGAANSNNTSLNKSLPDGGAGNAKGVGKSRVSDPLGKQSDSGVNVPSVNPVSPVASREAGKLEVVTNGAPGDSESSPDGIKSKPIVAQSDGVKKAPLNGTGQHVKPLVGSLVHDLEVSGGIVQAVSVDVVDNLGSEKGATKGSLSDKPVLKPLSSDSVNHNTDEPVRSSVTGKGSDVASAAGSSTHGALLKNKPNKTNDSSKDTVSKSESETRSKLSPRRQGESEADYLQRRADETNVKRGRMQAAQGLPTEEKDAAAVRGALGLDPAAPVTVTKAATLPDAKDKPAGLTKQAAQFVETTARLFGKRAVFYMAKGAEGFHISGNAIYINTNAQVSHLRILGHELTHSMRKEAKQAYQQMLDAVSNLLTPEELTAQFKDYFQGDTEKSQWRDAQIEAWLADPANKDMLTEEWMADLNGNRFAEPAFWTDVMTQLEGKFGQAAAKGIVGRLRAALLNALNKLLKLVKGNAFAVDARLAEHLEDIRKAVAAGFAEYARASKAGQLSEGTGETKFASKREDFTNQTLPTRWPTSKKLNPAPTVKDDLITDLATLKRDPVQYEKAVSAVLKDPGMRSPEMAKGTVDEKAEKIIERMKENLLWLHDQIPEAIRERSRLWYDGARKIAEAWAERYEISESQAAGALAVLSPQKDWFMNVTMAERVLDIIHTKMDHKFDKRMDAAAFGFLTKESVKDDPDSQKNLKAYEAVKGKTLKQVAAHHDLRQMSVWIRAYDEAYHDAKHAIVTPEGGFVEDKTTKSGDATLRAWGDFNTPGKAASIYLDGTPENINKMLGSEHKVRNFYNNIYAPKDPRFLTADTHAVAANELRPLAGADKPVAENFGKTGRTNLTGLAGTYALHYEAYRRAAEERGLLPREMQSITWEAVRGLFTEGYKGKKENIAAIDKIWGQVDDGELSVDDARQRIIGHAGGIENPDWWNEGNDQYKEVLRDKTYDPKRGNFAGAKVTFEVAPDPRNKALKARWDALPVSDKTEISHKVAWKIAAKALAQFGDENMKGEMHLQWGGWLADTNPSVSIWFNKRAAATKINDFLRVVGYALDQMSMVRTSPRSFDTGRLDEAGKKIKAQQFGAVTVELPADFSAEQVHSLYTEIRTITGKRNKPFVSGHTTSDGAMVILNNEGWSGIGNEDLAQRVGDRLFGRFDVSLHSVYADFPAKGKDKYGLRPKKNDAGGVREEASESSLRARADQLRLESGVLLDQLIGEVEQRGIKLSPERSDAAGRLGPRSGSGQVNEGTRPGSVSGTGVHYSKQQRGTLDSSFFGTGLKGDELPRVTEATDPRLKHRIYFYLNTGKGIKPEGGVGIHAHQADLSNIYDATNDSLDIVTKYAGKKNAFESALLDAGFDGYMTQSSGVAILLGERSLPVEYIGTNDRPEVPQAGTAEKSDFGKLQQSVVSNSSLPDGEMDGATWKRLMPKLMPEIDVSHLQDDQKYYKDQLVKRPSASIANVDADDELAARKLIEIHPPRDSKKLESLAADMSENGWVGRPILAWDNGNGTYALTGSHRIAAARRAEIDVPVVYVDSDKFSNQLDAKEETFDELIGSGDDRVADFLRQAGDTRAAELMDAEIASNEPTASADSDADRPSRAKKSPERKAAEWTDQTDNDIGPVYQGNGFSLLAVRKFDTSTDFTKYGLPWGHNAQARGEAYRFAIHDAQGKVVGFIDAEVNGLDEIDAIHDMAITAPGQGLGAKVVETIMASTYDGVRVIDVLPQSEKFWDRLGAGYLDANKNTRLDFEGSPAEARLRNQRGPNGRAQGTGQEARFSLRRALDGAHSTEDHLVPEIPLYQNSPNLVDLAYVNGKPLRLNVGVDNGAGSGYGALHILGNAARDQRRSIEQFTDDEGENVVREVLKALMSSGAQLHRQGGSRYALRLPLVKKTLIVDDRNGYYSVVTLLPSAENKWGDSDWRGRLTFPLPADATSAATLSPAVSKSSLDSLSGIADYSSEKFNVKPPVEFNQVDTPISVRVTQKKTRTIDKAAAAADGFKFSPPRFFSQLATSIDQIPKKMETMPAAQWRMWLNGNAPKLGIKKDEIVWSGIDDYLTLRGKEKVTKAEVQQFLSENGTQVKDTMLGKGIPDLEPEITEADIVITDDGVNFWLADGPTGAKSISKWRKKTADEAKKFAVEYFNEQIRERNQEKEDREDSTKFGQWVVPGGENYRELLITLPDGRKPAPEQMARPKVVDRGVDENGRGRFDVVSDGETLDTFNTWSAATDYANGVQEKENIERNLAWQKNQPAVFKSSHFDQPNILAHLRMDERTDAQGDKVLFLEELQSDWGQKGKKEGFDVPRKYKPVAENEYNDFMTRMKEAAAEELVRRGGGKVPLETARVIANSQPTQAVAEWAGMVPEFEELKARQEEDYQINQRGRTTVPSAPFVTDTKSWVALALKRAIMFAVQNGMSKVAWANGEQNAAHYDLSKRVDQIAIGSWSGGGYQIVARKSGDVVIDRVAENERELEALVGKDIAQKHIETGQSMFKGLDLKVGGEGMRAFYDQIVPQVANDVLKKLGGGKVETVSIEGEFSPEQKRKINDAYGRGTAADIDAAKRMKKPWLPQQGFTIPPSMAEKVQTEGVPLFSPSRATLGELTPDQQAAAERVFGTPKTVLQRLEEFKADWKKNLIQGLVDQFAPIMALDPKAYMLARLSKGGDGALEALMLYGKLSVGADGATSVRYTKAGGVQGFATKMAALKGEHDRFLAWVSGLRADRLKGIGLENLMSQADIDALKTLNQGAMKDGTPRAMLYAQALRDLNDFNDNVLKVAADSGLIDDATRQMYKDTPYIPFYRLQEEGDIAGFGVKPGLVNQQAWKKLKGGTQQLNEDMLANLLKNWSHLITASAKNRAAKATLDAATRAGIAAQIPAGTPGKGHVSYKEAGKDKVFIVDDPHLLDAVAALEYAGLGPWAKPFATAKHWLTVGVTANPTFKLRNLIRDSVQAIAAGELSYNPFENLSKGWAATAMDSETRAQMLASGGMMRFGSMLDGQNSLRAKELINQGVDPDMILDNDSKIKKMWKQYIHPAFEAYQEFGDRGEQVNRAALYERLLAKGMTNAEAAYWARDLMDFSMQGKWTAIRTLTQVVPFMNARLQGLYKLGRATKDDYRRVAAVMGAVVMASLALMLAYEDDDDWKKRSDPDRNNYWWFKIGGHAFRLPKPFEIGAVGTMAERGYEVMFNDEMTGKRFGENMRDIVMHQLSMNPTPQLIKPMMDLYANKDSFTGRDIETMGMERLRKEDRYDEKTSEVARFLGGLGLPDPTQLMMGRWDTLSPKQMDFLARGYFSWIGTVTTTALDYGIRPMLDRGERPAMQLKDVFFAGNFVETLPSNQSRYLTQMYDQAREIEQDYASWRHLQKLGDVEGARALMEKERAQILRYQPTEAMKRELSLRNVQLQKIAADKTLSAEVKRERIDVIQARRNQLAENFRAQ